MIMICSCSTHRQSVKTGPDCLPIRGALMTAPNWIQSRLKLACRRRNESSCIDGMPKESRRGAEEFFSRSADLNDLYYGFAPTFVKSVFHPWLIIASEFRIV